MIKRVLTILLFCTFSFVNAQVEFDWLYSIHNYKDKSLQAMAIDQDANLFLAGFFSDTLDFDPGPDNLELIAKENRSLFILKTDSSGKPLWVKQADFALKALTIDPYGNMVIAGSFSDTVDLDLSDSVQNVVSPYANGCSFIASYDKNLQPKWVNLYANIDNYFGQSLRFDSKGDLYWAGGTRDTIDFDADTGVYELHPTYFSASFLSKMDSSGNFIWAKLIEGGSRFEGVEFDAFKLDKDDNFYFGGSFSGKVDFDFDTSKFLLQDNALNGNPFVAKYDSNLKLQWVRFIGVSPIEDSDFIKDLTIDDSSNVYVAGAYPDSISFPIDSSNHIPLKSIFRHDSRGECNNGYIAKFDRNGRAQWAKSFTDLVGGFVMNYHVIESIHVDQHSTVHTLGYFGRDTLVLNKWTTSGQLIATDSLNGRNAYIEAEMFLDDNSSAYVVGRNLFGDIDFDPDSTTFFDTAANWKGFIAKYNYQPLPVSIKAVFSNDEPLKLFPNPTTNWFQIEGSKNEALNIFIYDINGKLIASYFNHSGKIHATLKQGLYLIRTSTASGKRSTFKLLVN